MAIAIENYARSKTSLPTKALATLGCEKYWRQQKQIVFNETNKDFNYNIVDFNTDISQTQEFHRILKLLSPTNTAMKNAVENSAALTFRYYPNIADEAYHYHENTYHYLNVYNVVESEHNYLKRRLSLLSEITNEMKDITDQKGSKKRSWREKIFSLHLGNYDVVTQKDIELIKSKKSRGGITIGYEYSNRKTINYEEEATYHMPYLRQCEARKQNQHLIKQWQLTELEKCADHITSRALERRVSKETRKRILASMDLETSLTSSDESSDDELAHTSNPNPDLAIRCSTPKRRLVVSEYDSNSSSGSDTDENISGGVGGDSNINTKKKIATMQMWDDDEIIEIPAPPQNKHDYDDIDDVIPLD